MTALLDANVLIALTVTDHVHHDVVEEWLTRWSEPFATCPTTQGALVRFLVRGGAAVGLALDAVRSLQSASRHEFWPDDQPYGAVDMAGVVGHRQVTDAYLAESARSHGATLATLDRGLAVVHRDVAILLAGS